MFDGQTMQGSTHTHRTWLLGILFILLAGAAYYLSVYDYWLPLPIDIDELRNMNEILLQRERIEDSTILKNEGYPPGILVIHTIGQL